LAFRHAKSVYNVEQFDCTLAIASREFMLLASIPNLSPDRRFMQNISPERNETPALFSRRVFGGRGSQVVVEWREGSQRTWKARLFIFSCQNRSEQRLSLKLYFFFDQTRISRRAFIALNYQNGCSWPWIYTRRRC
jgi:hypothetical protein